MLVQMPHPTLGTVRLAGTPLNLSATPTQMRLPPPLLGEHTDAILSRLCALDDSAIAELHRAGVV
jgi:crotonobetainyl-CoA:carnitine CoA-transferase CaiB-like acyl-CoA transferase